MDLDHDSQVNHILSMAQAYAKPTCRKCHGRGYRMIQPAPINYSVYGAPKTHLDYCSCVIKRGTKK